MFSSSSHFPVIALIVFLLLLYGIYSVSKENWLKFIYFNIFLRFFYFLNPIPFFSIRAENTIVYVAARNFQCHHIFCSFDCLYCGACLHYHFCNSRKKWTLLRDRCDCSNLVTVFWYGFLISLNQLSTRNTHSNPLHFKQFSTFFLFFHSSHLALHLRHIFIISRNEIWKSTLSRRCLLFKSIKRYLFNVSIHLRFIIQINVFWSNTLLSIFK